MSLSARLGKLVGLFAPGTRLAANACTLRPGPRRRRRVASDGSERQRRGAGKFQRRPCPRTPACARFSLF
ncbi:MAG: hypothetical protein ACLR7Z_10650 [Bilophila wadsworthia]